MLGKAIEILRVPELRKKILITLGLLFVYRIGFFVLLPGANPESLAHLVSKQGGSMFGVLNALSGGAIGSVTVFSLGVMPYISASIVFSLLAKMVPALEQIAKEGAQGQKKINQWTRWATVPICIVQAFFIVRGLIAQDVNGSTHPVIDPETFNTFGYQTAIVLILTTGTLFIMWLGEKISEHGIGQGTSLIIMAGIVARVPSLMATSLSGDSENRTQFLASIAGLFVVVVLAIVYFTKAQRRVPIQQAKLTRGRRQLAGGRHFIPFKVNASGVMPIVFAQALFIIPNLLANVPILSGLKDYFGYDSFLYIVLYTALIFFFSFFWTAIMFQPNEIANNLKEGGSFIPGIRPGKRTADYLEGVMVRTTLAGGAFLAAIALMPQFANDLLGTHGRGLTYAIGGTSILITVGVCLDLVDKVNAQLVMRNYEGFMSAGGTPTSSKWARKRREEGEGETARERPAPVEQVEDEARNRRREEGEAGPTPELKPS